MEQFIYALTDNGYVLSKSGGVDNLLKQSSIRILCGLNKSESQWWNAESCITVSTVKTVQDNFKREGVHNHTLVVPVLEYLGYTQPSRLLSTHRWNGEAVPNKLEAIQL